MSDGSDREPANDWATYLRDITNRPGWSVARLARESGLHRSTLFRWLEGSTGKTVAVRSVQLIANAAGDDLQTALRAAGGVLQQTQEEADDLDLEIRMIEKSSLPRRVTGMAGMASARRTSQPAASAQVAAWLLWACSHAAAGWLARVSLLVRWWGMAVFSRRPRGRVSGAGCQRSGQLCVTTGGYGLRTCFHGCCTGVGLRAWSTNGLTFRGWWGWVGLAESFERPRWRPCPCWSRFVVGSPRVRSLSDVSMPVGWGLGGSCAPVGWETSGLYGAAEPINWQAVCRWARRRSRSGCQQVTPWSASRSLSSVGTRPAGQMSHCQTVLSYPPRILPSWTAAPRGVPATRRRVAGRNRSSSPGRVTGTPWRCSSKRGRVARLP